MPPPPEYEPSKSAKHENSVLRFFTRSIGIISALAILSAIGFAIYKQIQLRPKLEWDYVDQMYGPDGRLLKRPKETNRPNEYDAAKAKESKTTANLKDLDKRLPELADMLQEFFEARTIPEILPLVRDARRVRPLIEDHYSRHPFQPRTFQNITWAVPVDEPGYRFAYAEVTFTDAPPINVVIELTDIGFLVDWESSIQYSEVDWVDFIKNRPADPKIFRLLASKTGDAGTESDTSGPWRIKLSHPSEKGDLYATMDPGDPNLKALTDQLELCKGKDAPVILRLRYPDRQASADVVEIASVEGKGWLILDRSRR